VAGRQGTDLAHRPASLDGGISTGSARGPETTGTNRYVSDSADTRRGDPTPESGGFGSAGRTIGSADCRMRRMQARLSGWIWMQAFAARIS
jgi:hypothetical protein